MKQKNGTALAAVLLATLLGASSGLYIKSLPFSGPAMTGFRMGVPFLIFLPGMIRKRMLLGPAGDRKQIWTGSLLNAVRMLLYVVSYKLTAIANAVVLLYTWPLFALLLHSFTAREKLKIKELSLLLLAFSGVIFLNIHRGFSLAGNDMKGSLLMLASALIYSAATLIFKGTLTRHSESEVLYFQNTLGALVFIPILLTEFRGIPASSILTGVLYGFSVGVAGFGCFFYALKRLPLFQYGALGYTEIFFGVLFGILIMGEDLRWNMILGAVLILISSFLSRMDLRQIRSSSPEN